MPRDGSEIYHIPAGTEGIPDTTIESDRYNTFIHDVEYDLNFPRPITAGGTGSTNSADALAELGAEMSSQVVTNYDSQLWTPGSFYSAGSATNPPVAGHAFVGWVVSSDPLATPPANNNVVVHARDQNDVVVPGRLWVREKKAGVWGSWSMDGTGLSGNTPPLNPPDNTLWWDNVSGMLFVYYNDGNSKQWVVASPQPDVSQFLLKAGDTMQGTLGLHAPPVNALDAANKAYVDAIPASMQPQIDTKVNKAGDTMTGGLTVSSGGINITGGLVEAGNVTISSGNVTINSGSLTVGAGITVTGNIVASAQGIATSFVSAASATTGAFYFGSNGAQNITYNGANFVFTGGGIYGPAGLANQLGDIYVVRNATQGALFFGSSGTAYHFFDGTYHTMSGGSMWLTSPQASYYPPNGSNGGFFCKRGDNNGWGTNYYNLYYLSGNTGFYVDNTYMGNFAWTSDYRTKKDVEPLSSMWDTVMALRPISYTQADFTPPIEREKRSKANEGPFVIADDIERWGFLAHELQETMILHAATGEKDMPNGLQSPNPFTLIAALTKALQEAMTRIEALEAKV